MFSWCKNDAITQLQEPAALSTLHGAEPDLCVSVSVCLRVCVRMRMMVIMGLTSPEIMQTLCTVLKFMQPSVRVVCVCVCVSMACTYV